MPLDSDLEGSGTDIETDTESTDDLEVTYVRSKSRELHPRTPPRKRPRLDDVRDRDDDAQLPRARSLQQTKPQPNAISDQEESSSSNDSIIDDEFNDAEAAYKKFKNRKSLARKRASLSAARRRAQAKRATPTTTTTTTANRTTTNSSIVGRVQPRGEEKPVPAWRRRKRDYGDEEEDPISSEDELMEHTLPDYLQRRRAQFDSRVERLKQAGLRLPPNFDDVEFSDDERLEQLREKPMLPHVKPQGEYKDIQLPYSLGLIPASIAQWLREYQVEGAAFLHELFVYQKGGILGDDMGLGKTVQVIAFLTAAYGKTGDERDAKRMRKFRRTKEGAWYPRTLIVCPGTLIENWKSELQRWGWWAVGVYHGDRKEEALHAARSGRLEILITTYTTYRMNRDSVNMVEWDCVIADECHIIKERRSETTTAMNEVNALCRIGLTGTAIQNKYEELWTLLNWTNPGKLGPVTAWRRAICEPLKIGQSHDATLYQLSKARKTAKKLVQNLLPRFFLRRMKTMIADQLPKKSDRIVFCPLTETQADAYENFLDSDVVQFIKTASDPCDCGSGRKAGWCCRIFLPSGERWQSCVFPAIANLQKLSNHLAILIPQGIDPKEKQEKDLEMLQIAMPDRWRELYRSRDSIIHYANPEFCGKWKVLRRLLSWWHANGDKVLVFSHNVRLLKMLQMLFSHTTYNVSYLDGSMSYEERAKVVDDFNSDPQQFVFLISTRAGGVGLNITSANKVVVFDPNWNPSHDLQAQDRAYRIGQQRDVEVFRLISAGTIEEIVYARQIYKQQQANIGYNASSERRYFRGVQEKKDQKGEIFGLENMFMYQNNNIVLRDIVNKTNIAESKAGVEIIGVDLDQDEDTSGQDKDATVSNTNEDDADGSISQLAAMISRGETDGSGFNLGGHPQRQKHDPIQAILATAGVEYSHLNNEVIGPSRIEERLSRRAELATEADAGGLGAKQVFADSPGPGKSAAGRRPRREKEKQEEEDDDDDGKGSTIVMGVRYKYHPPRDVRKRQFCSMARWFGFPSATEFALVVEGMTHEQRTAVLEKWYRERREKLLGKDQKGQSHSPKG